MMQVVCSGCHTMAFVAHDLWSFPAPSFLSLFLSFGREH